MQDFFPFKNSAFLSTAQLFSPFKSFNFNGKTVLLKQEKGVCGGNYYSDFGASVLPRALEKFSLLGKEIQSVFEAGSGRGVYLNFFGTIPSIKELWGVDIAPKAVRLTAENLERNGVKKFKLFAEPVEETFKSPWRVDLIVHDLPLIPLARNNFLPDSLRAIIDAGRTGRTFVDLMIKNSSKHLTWQGGLFFVQPSFIKGGKAKTRQLLLKNGFKPFLLAEKKKTLKETILTRKLKPFIEKSTGYSFPKDEKGCFFTMQAFLGIKGE